MKENRKSHYLKLIGKFDSKHLENLFDLIEDHSELKRIQTDRDWINSSRNEIS